MSSEENPELQLSYPVCEALLTYWFPVLGLLSARLSWESLFRCRNQWCSSRLKLKQESRQSAEMIELVRSPEAYQYLPRSGRGDSEQFACELCGFPGMYVFVAVTEMVFLSCLACSH